uniref:FHF complex subunit HOOK interacting protein 1A n=1 Tax=Scleropages formosus TaxID=113540 RepID=A0A8C9WRE4_SCLFO
LNKCDWLSPSDCSCKIVSVLGCMLVMSLELPQCLCSPAQVVKILDKHDPVRSGGGTGVLRYGPIPGDEASAVQNYVEHMLFLLMEEGCGQAGAMGPILEFVVTENVMEKLFLWSLRRQFTDDMKLEQLRMYEMLVGGSRQPLLHHKPVLRPLMTLLSSCSGTTAPAVEAQLVLLLHQLCSILGHDPSVLELFFHASEDQGAANFLIFSLLIPFIHREGAVGRQARDALLCIMALSAENCVVAEHIAENTYFCPVLATGLSGLYSSLPTKLEGRGEDWHRLEYTDWRSLPALVQFLNSLEFCNAVIKVAHPSIRSQLVSYIYNGFLALFGLWNVMTTTAYLELFLRSVMEPALLQTFLSFILLHQHENVHILDTLVSRINTPFQLGTVSLGLFRTLTGLYCEDVMLQLILRYLVPCSHMMPSQRRVLREGDYYSVSAARFLSLIPACCLPKPRPLHTPPLDCILWSKGADGPYGRNRGNVCVLVLLISPLCATAEGPCISDQGEALSEEHCMEFSCIIGPEVSMDVDYLQYLYDARDSVSHSIRACRVWSAPYDGYDPPPELFQSCPPEDGLGSPPRRTQGSHLVSANDKVNHLELEWDDSFDAVPCPGESEELQTNRPSVPAEPPKHIQEMKRSALMLIRGSYVEESEFQDDVMVYSLVAQKDAQDVVDRSEWKRQGMEPATSSPEKGAPQGQSQEQPGIPLLNGLSSITKHPEPEELNQLTVGVTWDKPEHSNDAGPPSRPGEDLISQYEELIGALGVESGSPTKSQSGFRRTISPAEEDEVDFSSFSADTPEAEKTPSPEGSRSRQGSNVQAAPFTGEMAPLPIFGVCQTAVSHVGGKGHLSPPCTTGPFISVLLSRLENMLENSLHVNLLLTDILAQLATYPQPLLRCFLLNTNMVLQPSVRSLYQVLHSLLLIYFRRFVSRLLTPIYPFYSWVILTVLIQSKGLDQGYWSRRQDSNLCPSHARQQL